MYAEYPRLSVRRRTKGSAGAFFAGTGGTLLSGTSLRNLQWKWMLCHRTDWTEINV
jgi:hypothetical protein